MIRIAKNRVSRDLKRCLIILLAALAIGIDGAAQAAEPGPDATPSAPARKKEPVFFMSGGTIDDFVVSIMLSAMPNIRFAGLQISNSDTIYRFAMQDQWKVFEYIGQPNIRFGLSDARGFNAFPWQYRNDSYLVSQSSALSSIADRAGWPPFPSGDRLLKMALRKALLTHRPVTVLATAPLTPLANILKANPELKPAIKKLIWMGGAINVAGNLDPNTVPASIANSKAEWNAFWDPYAVDWLFRHTRFPIVVFPLDVTDQAKLDPGFVASLAQEAPAFRYAALADSIYGLVKGQPYFEMWNTLTSAYLARPDLFSAPVSMRLAIETEGFWQGAIGQSGSGREVDVVLNLNDPAGFYAYVLDLLKRN